MPRRGEPCSLAAAALLAAGTLASCRKPEPRPKPLPPRPLGAEASRFGVDYVFPLQPGFRDPALARMMAQTGAGWVNFAEVSWAKIEPKHPEGGRHRYDWEKLDEAVRVWQAAGFRIVLSLRLQRGWFAGPVKYDESLGVPFWKAYIRHSDRLPAPGHRDDYRAWIAALVERYDGDGGDDMPGLKTPILHYQVGNEYCNPMFWTGTPEDYAVLLRETREAARGAAPDALVISNGIRWNDLFRGDPDGMEFEPRFASFLARLPSDEWRQGWKRMRGITEKTVALAGDYDILDAGGNGPYPESSAGYMAWVRRELEKTGRRPAVWDMEARSEPALTFSPTIDFFPEARVPGGAKVLRALLKRRDPRHAEAVRWYREEQARILTKVFITRFAAGFEKVFMGMPKDWDGSAAALSTPNPFIGLADSKGNPWPALEAFSSLVETLEGFSRARRVAAPEGVELYRFDFPDGKPSVWAAWLSETKVRGMADPLPAREVALDAVPMKLHLSPTPLLFRSSGQPGPDRRRESP